MQQHEVVREEIGPQVWHERPQPAKQQHYRYQVGMTDDGRRTALYRPSSIVHRPSSIVHRPSPQPPIAAGDYLHRPLPPRAKGSPASGGPATTSTVAITSSCDSNSSGRPGSRVRDIRRGLAIAL